MAEKTLALLLVFVASSRAALRQEFQRFPADPSEDAPAGDDGDYDAEAAMLERADHAVRSCRRFSDYNSPERVDFEHTRLSDPWPRRRAFVVDATAPEFEVCSPDFAWPEEWRQLDQNLRQSRPEAKSKKAKEQDPLKIKKANAGNEIILPTFFQV